MFWDGGFGLVRVVVVGVSAYLWLVLVLRVTGKRTLAQLNAFDFIVTVALGSTLATVLLSNSVALAEGVLALTLLAGLQLAVAWATTRVSPLRRAVTSRPTLLVSGGRFLPDALAGQRITQESVLQSVRASGVGGLDEVAAVVLETNGTVSVISSGQLGDSSALANVEGFDDAPEIGSVG